MLDTQQARDALGVLVPSNKQQVLAFNLLLRFIREVEDHQHRNRIPQTPALFKEKGS